MIAIFFALCLAPLALAVSASSAVYSGFAKGLNGPKNSVRFFKYSTALMQDTSQDSANNGATTRSRPRRRRAEPGPTPSPAKENVADKPVLDALENLRQAIERTDVKGVMNSYWNSPRLVVFNNNGTVTRGWEQVRANRASSYPKLKDVKLQFRDQRVQLLGPDAALTTCLWTQSQTVGGAVENASGRLTLVYRRIGGAWKIVHAHTSPDAPDQSRILPSERTEEKPGLPAATPAASPVRPPQ